MLAPRDAQVFRDANFAGVLHAGGILDDASLQNDLRRDAFAPKVAGAKHVRESTSAFSLHATVLFSSVVAQLGSSGQSNYSAANAVLDTLARNDAHAGLPTVSVQWGAWAHVGMAARDKKAMRKLARIGLAPMSPEDGLRALADVLGSCGLQTACAFDWPRLATSGADLQFYGEFVKHLTLNAEASHGAPTPDVSSALSDIAVLEAIKATVAEVLGCDGWITR